MLISVFKGIVCGGFLNEHLLQITSNRTSERPAHIFPFDLILTKITLPTNPFIFMHFEEKKILAKYSL